MIRPLPPANARMWPYTAAIRRLKPKGIRDASGGLKPDYAAAEPGVPCNVIGASVDLVPDLAVQAANINTVVMFPADHDLKQGDMIDVTDAQGKPWPKKLEVKRHQPLGIYSLRRWQADCLGS